MAVHGQLHESIALYTHSGSAPCVQAGRGERVVGLSFDMRGARERTNGAPIDVIVPEDGAGWEMEAFALMRNRPPAQAAAARRIADWAASKRANELYAQFYAVVAHRDVANKPANYPPFAEARCCAATSRGWRRTATGSSANGRDVSTSAFPRPADPPLSKRPRR